MDETKFTPGPWGAFNMVNETGAPMTPAEIGDYVKNGVIKTIESGGAADRFLFISTDGKDVPDICLVGNGPRGPHNAHLIAAAPDLYEALLAMVARYASTDAWEVPMDCDVAARAALAKARGEPRTADTREGEIR